MSLITDVLGGLWNQGSDIVSNVGDGIGKVWDIGSKFLDSNPDKLKNIGSIVDAVGGVYSIKEQSDFNEKMYDLEKTRIDDLYEKEEKQQKAIETGFANSEYGKGKY